MAHVEFISQTLMEGSACGSDICRILMTFFALISQLVPDRGSWKFLLLVRADHQFAAGSLCYALGTRATLIGPRAVTERRCTLTTSIDSEPPRTLSTDSNSAHQCNYVYFQSEKLYFDKHILEVTLEDSGGVWLGFERVEVEEDESYTRPSTSTTSSTTSTTPPVTTSSTTGTTSPSTTRSTSSSTSSMTHTISTHSVSSEFPGPTNVPNSNNRT
jgi:hypothetical protein